jgi:pSer/pThr/pTyr-binding forkhead associated (FHA) protein
VIESVELLIKQPGHPDRTVRLPEGATRMGRAEDNEVVLADVGVSRRHAQVYVSRTEVTVEDLGSGNGTYYNGYRVQSQAIADGDEVVVDPFVLQFRVRGGAPRAASEAAAARKGATQARLDVVVGTGMAGNTYPITSRGLSIGRSEDRDVVIPDPAASRHHAQISQQGNDYVMRDMGSSNGIYVNGVRVRECTLSEGDMLRIGNTEMRFQRFEEGRPPPPPPAPSPRPAAEAARSEPVGRNEPGFGEAPIERRSARSTATAAPAPSAAPRRGRSAATTGILALAFGGVFLLIAALVAVLVVIVIAIVYLKFTGQASVAPIPAAPPTWELKLPDGLPPADVSTLFKAGREKLEKGDRRGALQDFYRVMDADPKFPYVDAFAVASGEFLVIDLLQKEFSDRAAQKTERDKERDKLLQTARNGPRTQALQAQNVLKRKFKEDPVVIAALELPVPESLVALDKKEGQANEKMAAQKYDEAVELYEQILAATDDPTRRKTALTNLRASAKEVARASAPAWTDAVRVERTDPNLSRAGLQALATAHPANPSAAIRLGKR